MAVALDFYEKQETTIGVRVSSPANLADVSKAINHIVSEFREFHHKAPSDNSIIVTSDDEEIRFEFIAGSV